VLLFGGPKAVLSHQMEMLTTTLSEGDQLPLASGISREKGSLWLEMWLEMWLYRRLISGSRLPRARKVGEAARKSTEIEIGIEI